jgi:hypothetical protein
LEAVSGMVDQVRDEHTKLASNVQAVFDEQAGTASDAVSADFSKIIDKIVDDRESKRRVLRELMEMFMLGMKSMGSTKT